MGLRGGAARASAAAASHLRRIAGRLLSARAARCLEHGGVRKRKPQRAEAARGSESNSNPKFERRQHRASPAIAQPASGSFTVPSFWCAARLMPKRERVSTQCLALAGFKNLPAPAT